jgi:uncharacterized protein (TIGR03435 family)
MAAYRNVVLLTSLTAFCAYSQTVAEPRHFEAASLKLLPPGQFSRGIPGSGVMTQGKLTLRGHSLTILLAYAYDVREDQIVRPSWVDIAYYDIFATMPPSTTRQEARLMLRTLLSERLAVTIHKELRQSPIYALYVAPKGPKFAVGNAGHADTEDAQFTQAIEGSDLHITGDATIAQLIRRIAIGLDAGIVDKTGLQGTYAISLAWDIRPNRDPDGTYHATGLNSETLAAALEAQLGLKMKPEKGPVETIVVSHAERVPIEQ